MNGERVDAARKLARKRLVHHAVTLDPALPFEGVGHDIDPVMGFSTGPVARVAGMLVGFIDHVQARRGKRPRQPLNHAIPSAHGVGLMAAMPLSQYGH